MDSPESLWGSFPPQNIHSLLGLFVGVEGSHVFGCPHLFRFLPGGSISVAIKYGKVSTLGADDCFGKLETKAFETISKLP